MTQDQCDACAKQVQKECARADRLEFQLKWTVRAYWLITFAWIILLIAALSSGCSQPPPSKTRINAQPEDPEHYTVKLQSEELLKAASDFEYWNGRYSNSVDIDTRGTNWAFVSTNPFTVFYYRETGWHFTNWLSKSRPVLYDKTYHTHTAMRVLAPFLSPPKPPTLPKHAKRSKVAPRPIAVAPLPYFLLTWEDLNTNCVTFNVYGTSDYKVWTLLTNVPRQMAYLPMKAPCQVYWITALDNHNHESRKPTGWIK